VDKSSHQRKAVGHPLVLMNSMFVAAASHSFSAASVDEKAKSYRTPVLTLACWTPSAD